MREIFSECLFNLILFYIDTQLRKGIIKYQLKRNDLHFLYDKKKA